MRRLKQIGDLLRALSIERNLCAHDGWTPDELGRHQRRELTTLVRHTLAHSRFYRELYAGLSLGEEVDLGALP